MVADLTRLLPDTTARPLMKIYQDRPPAQVMAAVLEAFPAGDPVVVMLDNLESVMDPATETLAEPALMEALTELLTGPAHAVTVIATTRVSPTSLLGVNPGAQHQQRLDEGLGPEDAETVLRELDPDGALGLRDAPTELLHGLRAHTRGFPRALEAVKAILDGDPTLTPQDLLSRTRDLPGDRVVEVLVGEAYQLLDPPAQRVMEALAVYPSPVSNVGVDFLLQPFDPTTDAAPILTRLVRRQLAHFDTGLYRLHPVDRDYALAQIPPGAPGDPATAFTIAGLQSLAADYYAQIRTPRESWRSLDDIQPQLAEFDLRCAAGDYDAAATVLAGIDYGYLRVWGHHRTLADLHHRIHGRISDPTLNAQHLGNYGNALSSLGHYRQAIDLYTQALTIYRDTGYRDGEAAALGALGNCHSTLGDYQQAIDLHTQALTIHRDTSNQDGEAAALGNLGNCYASLGDYRQAIDLYTRALTIYRDTGHRDGEAANLGDLGNCHSTLGDYQQAIKLYTQALTIRRDTGHRDGQAANLGNLGNCHSALGNYQQAIDLIDQSLTIARETGNRYYEATSLDYLGWARLAAGDASHALEVLSQAVTIADDIGDTEPATEARSDVAQAYLELSDPAAARTAIDDALQWEYPIEQPTLLLLKGITDLQLGRTADAKQEFDGAIAAADDLLNLVDRNVSALQSRALALCGLAVAMGDSTKISDATAAFARLRAVTRAAGVRSASLRLVDQIRHSDQTGILADLSAEESI